MSTFKPTRRMFLKTTGLAGGGLMVGVSVGCSGTTAFPMAPMEGGFVPNAFLQVTQNNRVCFYCPRDEMGQGVSTGLATLVAEELDVDPQRIEVEFAGVHPDYANPDFGLQITGGSSSIKAHYYPLRQAAANVRALLLAAAAADLGVPVARLSTNDGHVLLEGEPMPYGRFVATASGMPLPQQAPLKPRTQFKYIGHEFPRIDALAKSTGTAVYGIDVEVPGMHYAVIKRSPVAGGRALKVEASQALAMPGVTDVVQISSGVAVVARRFWQAKQAVAAVTVEWSQPALAALDTATVRADYRRAMQDDDGDTTAEQGDPKGAFAAAAITIDQEYWAPFLAHAPLEPMNAVVRIGNGSAEVWTGTQSAQAAQGLVARYAGLSKDRVRVHNTYLGGAFGRRATLTHVVEATEAAVATGKPIQVLWTREDDIRHGLYRPASLMRIRAAIDADGTISAWQAKRVGGNITPDTLANALPAILPTAVPQFSINWMTGLSRGLFDGWMVDSASIEGLFEDYDFPNRAVTHVTRDHGLPLTFWRSVGHSYTAFAKESAVDELAHASGRDPVQLRLDNTRNNPRLHGVIRAVADAMQGLPPEEGRAIGVAAHASFNSYVAQAAEVSVDGGTIKVHRVLCAVDCGQVVNPDIVRAQMEGAIMYGLTAALHGKLELEAGAIKESNFHDYPILRMNEAPAVDVIIVDSDADPTGVGEPGLPPIAPAVANAVFAITGQRLRSLPLELA